MSFSVLGYPTGRSVTTTYFSGTSSISPTLPSTPSQDLPPPSFALRLFAYGNTVELASAICSFALGSRWHMGGSAGLY